MHHSAWQQAQSHAQCTVHSWISFHALNSNVAEMLTWDVMDGCWQLAPMSTTTNMETAVSYSVSSNSLIFRILTKNQLQRGADLAWLSAFPTEAEVLYPPLTYLQPTGRTQLLRINTHCFTIVEVAPTIA